MITPLDPPLPGSPPSIPPPGVARPPQAVVIQVILAEIIRNTLSHSVKPNEAVAPDEFHLAFDTAVGAIGVTDLDGRLLLVNPALQRLLDRPPGLAPPSSLTRLGPEGLVGEQASLDALVYGGHTQTAGRVVEGTTAGATVHVLMSVTNVLDALGVPSHLVVRVDDVADFVAHADELAHQVLHDPLTELPNRALFLDRLEHEVAGQARSGQPVAVLYLDVDDFKFVNDQFGHAVGDSVLAEIGARLRALIRPGDTAARLSGDEFAVLCENSDSVEAAQVGARVHAAFAEPIMTEAGPVKVSVSVGSASTTEYPGADGAGLLRVADSAMYEAKRATMSRRGVSLPELLPDRSAPNGWLAQVRSVYQPIVDLDTRVVMGYEALARGPAGSRLHTPEALFAAAREQGLVSDLDWVCRLAALNGAVHAQLPANLDLYVNAEPQALDSAPPSGASAALRRAAGLSVIMEITERDLTTDPAGLLRAADQARARGWRIAVDDVGANRASLALLPFLHPDVIKLDLSLVQAHTTVDIAEIITAVNAQAERTGAVVLAEGIETEAQAQLALMMGARLGQGWLFGRPAPLPQVFPVGPTQLTIALASRPPNGATTARAVAGVPAVDPATTTPFLVAAATGGVRRATKPLLVAISLQLERQAQSLGASAVVLTTFQHARYLTPATTRRYESLASSTAYVAVFGIAMNPEPVAGVRGVALTEDEPLANEWSVIVVGPYFTGAMMATSLGDAGPEEDQRFDYRVTYDRPTVLAAAMHLMHRIPSPPTPPTTRSA